MHTRLAGMAAVVLMGALLAAGCGGGGKESEGSKIACKADATNAGDRPSGRVPHSGRADDHGGSQGRPVERRRRLLDRGPRRGLQGVLGPVKEAGYDTLFTEKEDHDAEISYKGSGRTGPDRAARRLLGERHHEGAHHEPSRVAEQTRRHEPDAADRPNRAGGGQCLRAPGSREHARLQADGDRPLRTGRPRRLGRVRDAARHLRARAGHAGLRLELAVRARARGRAPRHRRPFRRELLGVHPPLRRPGLHGRLGGGERGDRVRDRGAPPRALHPAGVRLPRPDPIPQGRGTTGSSRWAARPFRRGRCT